MELPLDEEDYRYTKSFRTEECESAEAKEFWETYGFIIFCDAVTEEQCCDLEQDMAALLEETGKTLTAFGMPKGVNSLFRPALLRLRQDPNIARAFSSVLQTHDFLVSHDRWLWHQAPAVPSKPLTRRNLHLDLNPWDFMAVDGGKSVQKRLDQLQYNRSDRAFIAENNDVHNSMGTCIQAIVNLSDIVDSRSGGTILIPGSHRTFDNWIQNGEADEGQRREGPMQYKFDDQQPVQSLAQHPNLRRGSLLIWEQRVVHGSTPNKSSTSRMAVPIRAFKREALSQKRAMERGRAIEKQIGACGFGGELTVLGRKVFGLDVLSAKK